MTGLLLALLAANPFAWATGPFAAFGKKVAQLHQKYGFEPEPDSLRPFALPPGFDCSRIRELGFDKMENFKAQAVLIACGEGGGKPSHRHTCQSSSIDSA